MCLTYMVISESLHFYMRLNSSPVLRGNIITYANYLEIMRLKSKEELL